VPGKYEITGLAGRFSPHRMIRSSSLLFWRLLTVAWAAVIYHLSTESYGSSFSAPLLVKILAFLRISVSPSSLESLNFLLRKSAHITEYGILGLLLYRTFLNRPSFEWRPRSALWSVLIAGLYAVTDECHQIYEPGRTASVMDSGIDTVGALLGMLVIYGRQFVQSRGAPGQERQFKYGAK
jgi:VanZ family protein